MGGYSDSGISSLYITCETRDHTTITLLQMLEMLNFICDRHQYTMSLRTLIAFEVLHVFQGFH